MLVRPQKGFTTITVISEKNSDFGFFELSKGISVQKAQEGGKGGREKCLRFSQKPR